MAVRLALASDAAAITAMYNAAVPTISTYWPSGAIVMPQAFFDGKIALGEIYVSASTALGAARGFIARRPRSFRGDDGDEMDLWIIPTSATATQLRAWTKELWTRWAQDQSAAKWLWGRNAAVYPTRTENLIALMVSKGLIFVDTSEFRVAKMRPADLLTVLGQL